MKADPIGRMERGACGNEPGSIKADSKVPCFKSDPIVRKQSSSPHENSNPSKIAQVRVNLIKSESIKEAHPKKSPPSQASVLN